MSSERISFQSNRTAPVFPRQPGSSRTSRVRSTPEDRRPLRVMKFGGTSVGDAGCIKQVAEIIKSSVRDGDLVVVVSAMGGVTNKLLEAASQAASRNRVQAAAILDELREQHQATARALIRSELELGRVQGRIEFLLDECASWCESTAACGELTPRMKDSISSLGERLSVPLVAAALASYGVVAEPLEATDLIITDSSFGGADPKMEPTTERCGFYLRPLLRRGTVPIVTGFIGADENGALTTLGRGGSDYSATIVGAALNASEVIIWTDVDGILTADPRLVPSAITIPEISYREASELAHYGAKVLHPKTLRPVMEDGIPVWIRNTFAPVKRGTKITPIGNANRGGVKAVTANQDVALIKVTTAVTAEAMTRILDTAKAAEVDLLLVTKSPCQKHVFVVVSSARAEQLLEGLRKAFAAELESHSVEEIAADNGIAILTVVGEDLQSVRKIVKCTTADLSRDGITILASGQGSSACNVSLVVAKNDLNTALFAAHREVEQVTAQTHGRLHGGILLPFQHPPHKDSEADSSLLPDWSKPFGPAGDTILDEETFRSMIAYERKRTERSRKPVLLMLLEVGDGAPPEAGARALRNVLSALSQSCRDTDITGWYKNNSVVGAMFTETGIEDPGAIMATMMHRVGETLRYSVTLEKASQINISLHVFPESWNQQTSAGNPTLYPDLQHREESKRSALAFKRMVDIAGSLLGITLFAPLFLVIAALIKLTSRGPILFKQERIGQFGKPFNFLKFRSMYANNDPKIHQDFMKRVISGDHQQGSKMENDPRITWVGRFLRKSSLDELPQFFCVLGGAMSLVGPRPPLAYEVQEYDIWHRRRVLEVKPGITGLWQVKGRSRLRFDEMVRLDLQYVRTWSVWLDLWIMLKTPVAVVRGGDAF